VQVTARAVRDFLSTPDVLNKLYTEKKNRYFSLQERATKTTSTLTGMPGGGNSDHEAVLASLADAVDEAAKWRELSEDKRELIHRFINEADIDAHYKDILLRRYYLGLGWAIILGELQWDGAVCRRKMFYDHNRALEACAAWVNKTGKFKEEIA